MTETELLRAFFSRNNVIIVPANEQEVVEIQTKILSCGIVWKDGDTSIGVEVENCLNDRMGVYNEKLVFCPGTNLKYNRTMTGREFLAFQPKVEDSLSLGEAFLLKEFRAMAERLANVEAKLAQVCVDAAPIDLGKLKSDGRNLPKP